VLGVRQNTPGYARARHPRRRSFWLAADLMDAGFRLLGRRCGVVVVGPELARRYGRSRDLLEITVSLVDESDIGDVGDVRARDYSGRLQVLSVGRLETEKNPLLLAEVLAALVREDPRWQLVVCGEGPLEGDLRAAFESAQVAEHVTIAGYVALRGGLLDLYRDSHMLLHVSFTEGVPQVLYEAFAAALPVVATAVGGVQEAAGGAAVLIPSADAEAAVDALKRLAGDAELRERIVEAGIERVRSRTLTAESERVAQFISRGR
jgi:glycosyltransferase involved in cell wall biosynthesis